MKERVAAVAAAVVGMAVAPGQPAQKAVPARRAEIRVGIEEGDFRIRGPHHDLVFRGNTIGHSKPAPGAGIRSTGEARGLQAEENRFQNVTQSIVTGT